MAVVKDISSETVIRLVLDPLEEGGYVASSPDVPGLVAQGRSVSETVEIAQDVIRKIAETCIEQGFPLPPALAAHLTGNERIELDIPVSTA
jgi:antitoxin HicB